MLNKMHAEKCSKIWSWWIPALLALVSVLGMWGVYEMMFAMREAADISGEGMDAEPLLMMSFLLLLLFFVYGLVWLVVSIVICVRQRCWWSLLGRPGPGVRNMERLGRLSAVPGHALGGRRS